MFFVTLLFSSLFSPSAASPTFHARAMHSSRAAAPPGFVSLGNAPADQSIKLRFALASNDVPGLERALLDVSTPSSPHYGKHLTNAEVNTYLAPSNEALAAVHGWLTSNNVTGVSSGAAGDWLTATIPISRVNDLLGANYETFQHLDSGISYLRTLSYSLPTEVAGHIDDIHPSTSFDRSVSARSVLSVPHPRSVGGASFVPESCNTTITPACLQALYGIPKTPATQSSNGIAVTGFDKQFAQQSDLTKFLGSFRKDMSNSTTFTLQTFDGGKNPQSSSDAGLEALDIQYTVGLATNVPVAFVSGGSDTEDGLDGFLDIINFLSAEDHVPQVLTTSYGLDESEVSLALAIKLCNAYMGFGARGTSILFSSGDGAVTGASITKQNCTTFQPTFPSGCPYITTVGAVQGVNPETASEFSSGGFSNHFGVPAYQTDAVAEYLVALGSTNHGLFNRSGRGYPDVSAQGENVQIVLSGNITGVEGTSCSTPIFASVIALLNDELIATGKSPLGFLNPWLYSNAAALNDVTTGSNPGCGGWDPVTGLGTPNYAALRTAAGL
ncbi:family S53 protease [Mycena galopus ATCC 62051]|nr:family S53 protease [Mycena galopus ATCC 62051]